jgi:ribose/xylose/arabinose/galactoside ABC-type transport system permease subunit
VNPTQEAPGAVARPDAELERSRRKGAIALGARVARDRPLLLLVLIVALSLFMVAQDVGKFLTFDNIANILLDSAQSGILVVGMMMLLIGGAFDLSIGGVLALCGIVTGVLVQDWGLPPILALFIGIGAGTACGLTNGLIVTRLRINALIATLATVGIFRGLTQLISGGGVSFIGHGFDSYGQAVFLGMQSPFWVMLVVVLGGAFLMGRTRFFRQYYYVGSNPRAAALSGINVDRMVLIGFVIMGTLAGLTGVLLASRLNSAVVLAGTGVELRVITAAVLGGASLAGGSGRISGAFLGVLFMSLVQNALILSQVTVFWQNIVVGVVLIVAVSIDSLGRRNR